MFHHYFNAVKTNRSLLSIAGLHSRPMSDTLIIPNTKDKKVLYENLIPQLKGLFHGEKNFIANCANGAAAIHQTFQFHWTGFYFVEGNELVLGPFQGPIACTRIAFGKGVCGNAWKNQSTILVEDVESFPGHIACSALSKSEIVVPLKNKNGVVFGVLDIDSDQLAEFNEIDQAYLEQIAELFTEIFDHA